MIVVTVKFSASKYIDLRGFNMSGLSGLLSRMKKCQKYFNSQKAIPKRSVVYMGENGEMILEDGVEYNESGILLIPREMTLDEWESENIKRMLPGPEIQLDFCLLKEAVH